MNCIYCGHELSDDDKTCPVCGNVNKYYKDVRNQEYRRYGSKDDTPAMGRLSNGYVDLKTKWYNHLLIALAYIAMNVLTLFIARVYIKSNSAYGCYVDQSCSDEIKSQASNDMTIIQVLVEIALILIIAFIFIKKWKYFFKELGQGKTWMWFGIGIGVIFGFNIVYNMFLQALGKGSDNTNQESVMEFIFSKPMWAFMFVCIAAPLFEELVFRFGVFRAFCSSKKMQIIGIIVTSLLFAGIHMVATFEEVFSGEGAPNYQLLWDDLLTFPSYIAGALVLTFSYYKTKNLATPILIHIANNFISYISIMMLVSM